MAEDRATLAQVLPAVGQVSPAAVGPIGSRRWTRASVLGAIPQSPPNSSARRSERADQRRAGGSRGGRDARRCCSRGPSRRRTPRRQQAPSVPLEAGPRRAWRVSVLGLARRAVGDSPLALNAGAAHSGTSARTTSFVHAVDRRAGAQRRRSCATRQHRRRRASIQPEPPWSSSASTPRAVEPIATDLVTLPSTWVVAWIAARGT